MAVCAPQTLLDEQPCYSALLAGQRRVLDAQLLCELKSWLASGGVMTCDVQALLTSASCFGALTAGQLEVVIDQLQCDINSTISSGLFKCGHGSPEGVVVGQFCNQPYLDVDTGTKYSFNGTVGSAIGWV